MVDAILKAGATTKYTFNIISGMHPSNKKVEQTPMNIPSMTNPFVFDGKSQERRISFDFYILPSAYSIAGTGSILTQQEDLDYLHRNQADLLTAAGVSKWTLAVTYPANMDHAPEDPLNEGGVTSGSNIKNYYVTLDSVSFPRNAGELYIICTVECFECDEVFGL